MICEGDGEMREILFRGKRKSDGKWIEGDLSRCLVVGETHIRRIEDNLSTTTHRITPDTVCQYTGLTDKNGRKIFEGDVIKHFNQSNDDEKYVVGCIKWDQDSCKFVKEKKDGAKYTINNKCTYEVIGNIFDNPELLKG